MPRSVNTHPLAAVLKPSTRLVNYILLVLMAREVEENNTLPSKITDGKERVHDSSIDLNRELPLRASTGVWKASFFIIGKG